MRIQLTVIEDLGIKLYTKLPPVIAEIVANCWDADANSVNMRIPEGPIHTDSEISIEDDGCGMTYDEIQNLYLRIGRKRREEENRQTTPKLGRPMMGRKGIGKLSIFGIANQVEVETVKNHLMNSFEMNIEDILRDARDKGKYNPTVRKFDEKVDKEQGTTVRLRHLKRTTKIDVEAIRRKIAGHFSVIGDAFRVTVNDRDITATDKFRKGDMVKLWPIEEAIDSTHPDWKVDGWIGATATPLDEEDRGVVIMARGKLLQTPTSFEAKVGAKYSYSYLVGEINAEFLDAEEDLIATHRQSVVWESPQGSALREWGQTKLRKISDDYAEWKRTQKERNIREDPEFKEWLETLAPGEKKVADRVIHAITADETLSPERQKELANYMKVSFDETVFQEMANALGDNPTDARLIETFEIWDVIEAREILRLVKGRIANIEQFEKLVKINAREKPTLHKYFWKWPWLLDPTWTRWQDEVQFSELLREKYPEEELNEQNRRIDFVCIGTGDTVHVIELKRPGYVVKSKDFDQLLSYVEFVRDRLGNVAERGYRDAAGYLVAGEVSDDRETRAKMRMYEKNRMYVKQYSDLISVARRLHAEFEDRLKEFEARRKIRQKQDSNSA